MKSKGGRVKRVRELTRREVLHTNKNVRRWFRSFHSAVLPAGWLHQGDDAFLRLAQIAADDGTAVEWIVLTRPGRTWRSDRVIAVRAEFDEYQSRLQWLRRAGSKPVVRVSSIELSKNWPVRVRERLAAIRIPSTPGLATAPPFLFPECVLEFGDANGSFGARASFRWINPRKSAWRSLIREFHTMWHELECRLDRRPIPRRAPIPPSGGEAQFVKYEKFRAKVPLLRFATQPTVQNGWVLARR